MKKFITKFIVLVLAVMMAATVFTAAACSKECDHDVSNWVTIQEPTCSTEGIEEGVCSKCLKTVQQAIPVNSDAHVYGDWVVTTPYPTASSTGLAIKTCSECGNAERLTLPALTDRSYTSTVTKRPTASKNGSSTYTYTTDDGDIITFNVDIERGNVQTVSDAVDLAAASDAHDLVRSASGYHGTSYYEYEGSENNTNLAKEYFDYELYDTYTHIVADYAKSETADTTVGGSEYWMSLDGSEIFGYVKDEQGNFTTASDTNYFYGYRYYIAHTDTLSYAYGTENFLSMLYTYAKADYNGDFEESVTTTASGKVYSFSFGTYNVYSEGKRGALFSEITVSFTLSNSYTVKWLKFDSTTHENDSTLYVQNSETGEYEWSSDAPFNVDENNHAYVVHPNISYYTEIIEVEQTLRSSSDTEQTSPYDAASRFYNDFDLVYNGNVVAENTVIDSFSAGTSTGSVFTINLKTSDSTPIYGDSVSFYYRTFDTDQNGTLTGTYTDKEINYGTESSVGIFVYYNDSTGKFYIKSNITGDVHIVVKTKKVAKEYIINFTTTVPDALYSYVYSYDTLSGYTAPNDDAVKNAETATVYAGQTLYFKAGLGSSQKTATETYNIEVTTTNSTSDYNVIDISSLTLSTKDVVSVSEFVAYKAGTYVLKLTSTVDSDIYCTITVTVEEMPSMSTLLSGTYSATFDDRKKDVTVAFSSSEPVTTTISNTTVTDSSGATIANSCYECTFTATVTYNGISRNILVSYYYCTVSGTTYMLYANGDIYTVTNTPENILTSVMEADEDKIAVESGEEYIFRIEFNEAYSLVISHSLGVDDASESVTLTKSEN